METQLFVALYDYNAWANRRVWDGVQQLSEEEFNRPIDYSIGSIHNQVAHTMAVEYWWFKFLSTGELDFPSEADCATRESIRAKWDATEPMIRACVATLTPGELQREVKPPFWEAEKPPLKVFEALFQVANHSLDHRAQTLVALNQVGGPTTPQDYIFYKFEQAGVPWVNE
jgi:uncharacterized damage-inducible protein DinB